MLVNMVNWDDPEQTLKPLIDGGTEGVQNSRPPLTCVYRISGTGSIDHTDPNFLL